MSVDAFKYACMMVKGSIGNQVREYFVRVEKMMRKFVKMHLEGKIEVLMSQKSKLEFESKTTKKKLIMQLEAKDQEIIDQDNQLKAKDQEIIDQDNQLVQKEVALCDERISSDAYREELENTQMDLDLAQGKLEQNQLIVNYRDKKCQALTRRVHSLRGKVVQNKKSVVIKENKCKGLSRRVCTLTRENDNLKVKIDNLIASSRVYMNGVAGAVHDQFTSRGGVFPVNPLANRKTFRMLLTEDTALHGAVNEIENHISTTGNRICSLDDKVNSVCAVAGQLRKVATKASSSNKTAQASVYGKTTLVHPKSDADKLYLERAIEHISKQIVTGKRKRI